jgi:hypothetical protein
MLRVNVFKFKHRLNALLTMIVPSLTNVTREVVPMHVCLQNVVRLLYARLKRMKEYAIA